VAGVAKHDWEKEIEERREVRKRSGQIGDSVLWWVSGPRANREQPFPQHMRRNGRVAGKMAAFAFAIFNYTSKERVRRARSQVREVSDPLAKGVGVSLESWTALCVLLPPEPKLRRPSRWCVTAVGSWILPWVLEIVYFRRRVGIVSEDKLEISRLHCGQRTSIVKQIVLSTRLGHDSRSTDVFCGLQRH
jgi:hypothetical protein